MSPQLAAAVFATGILGLLYLDEERNARISPAVWIAVVWLFLGSSRMVSQWLGSAATLDNPTQYLEGSPIDRAVLTGLLGIAVLVLISRGGLTVGVLKANAPALLFFGFCAASILWSDFPQVAFKRWTKAVGNLVMVLLILTEQNPLMAIKQLFARTGFILIPLSILLIKYYPALGRGYNGFTWTTFYCGASTDKNGLGTLCLVFGLASFWMMVRAFQDKERSNRGRHLVAHGLLQAMNIWLLWMAHSSTSLACFILGCAIILITTFKPRPSTVHTLAGSVACVAVLAYMFQDAYAGLVGALGRDTNLTGRTDIWNDLFTMNLNPLVGTGFESFWLGPRAEYFWNKYYFHPNQAHNGYIEIYITLGILGLALLTWQFVAGYRNIVSSVRRNLPFASLQLALLVAAALYNMTEAAFKIMHPVWIAFLFSTMTTPLAKHAVRRESLVPQGRLGRGHSRSSLSQPIGAFLSRTAKQSQTGLHTEIPRT